MAVDLTIFHIPGLDIKVARLRIQNGARRAASHSSRIFQQHVLVVASIFSGGQQVSPILARLSISLIMNETNEFYPIFQRFENVD